MAKKIKTVVESVAKVEPKGESEARQALRALYAAQKLSTPAAYEWQNKDAELAKLLEITE